MLTNAAAIVVCPRYTGRAVSANKADVIPSREKKSSSVRVRATRLEHRRIDQFCLLFSHRDELWTEPRHSIRVVLHDELPMASIDLVDGRLLRYAEDFPPMLLLLPESRARFLSGSLSRLLALFFLSGSLARRFFCTLALFSLDPKQNCCCNNAAERQDQSR
jgi:hypothetical protein